MVPKRAVAVRIRGQEFRVLSDDDEAWLQRVAGYLDETMATVEERTGTVDSLDVALLTALNLARELVEIREREPIREREGSGGEPAAGPDRARRVRAASGGGLSRRRGTSYPDRHVRRSRLRQAPPAPDPLVASAGRPAGRGRERRRADRRRDCSPTRRCGAPAGSRCTRRSRARCRPARSSTRSSRCGIPCLFPRVLEERGLAFAAVADWSELRPGRYGVLEPPRAGGGHPTRRGGSRARPGRRVRSRRQSPGAWPGLLRPGLPGRGAARAAADRCRLPAPAGRRRFRMARRIAAWTPS